MTWGRATSTLQPCRTRPPIRAPSPRSPMLPIRSLHLSERHAMLGLYQLPASKPRQVAPSLASASKRVVRRRLPISSSSWDYPVSSSRYLAGPSLEAVPEARESPFIGSSDAGTPSALRIATALPPTTSRSGERASLRLTSAQPDPNAGAMASFSFPSPSLLGRL